MTNWWQVAFSGACLVALGTLALGLWVGIRIGQDRAADDETAARFAAVPDPGRHRVAEPRRLPSAPKQATGSTAEMFARLEAEVNPLPLPAELRRQWQMQVAEVPVMAPGPRLGDLVRPSAEHRPGRATDFITALEADTDRFIAQMGARQ